MSSMVQWTLPVPSTALLDGGVALEKRLGRDVALRYSYEADDDTRRRAALIFKGVEAFKCTYHRARDLAMLEAYDKLIDRGASAWLNEISTNLSKNGSSGTGLVHLVIGFDDGPTYEFVCRSFAVEEAT